MLPSRGLIFWNCIKFRPECPPQYLCTVWVKSDVESYQSDKSQRQDIKVFVLKHYTLKITVSQHVKLEVNGKMVGNTFPSASGGQAPYRPPWRLHGKAYYLSFVCIRPGSRGRGPGGRAPPSPSETGHQTSDQYVQPAMGFPDFSFCF